MTKKHLIGTLLVGLAGTGIMFFSCGDDDDQVMSEADFRGGSPALSGAIFTTMPDGSRVNANIYPSKEDVYLDGGPGPNAPATAAGLPEGDYYFQVTDPSGKDLLSSDHISCRSVHVNAAGLIDQVYPGTTYTRSKGSWNETTCQHNQGIDIDHGTDGAITVQLMPYDDTPNKGGVYKVWLTRVEDYTGDDDFVPDHPGDEINGENWEPGNFHGFVPARSKTDNYKVKKGKPFTPPLITLRKFHDANINGVADADEEWVNGWNVAGTDPLGVTNNYYTPDAVTATDGIWGFVESMPAGSTITASYLDGTQLSTYPDGDPLVILEVEGASGETHEVIYGDVGVGQINACKVYDRNGNGVADSDEPPVPNWGFTLTGTDVTGATVGPLQGRGGSDGCTVFADLLPGSYEVNEAISGSGEWTATGPTSQPVTIESTLIGAAITGTSANVAFTNLCEGTAGFGTKGYWHNKNGLSELTSEDIEYANSLEPYRAPSSYFDDGDEPFDGFFSNGDPVEQSIGSLKEEIAPAGTPEAEVSQFLVDANANGDPREQLAQQLLAFIFNTRHRLDGPDASIKLPDGEYTSAAELIDQAIQAWSSGTADEQQAIKNVLEGFNQSSEVSFIHVNPCAVTVPA